MTMQIISHREKSPLISHGEKKARPRAAKSPRELELMAKNEALAREVRYLKAKYAHVDAETLAARAKAVQRNGKAVPTLGVDCKGLRWVEPQDVVDYCAGVWLCHPSNRMFRQYLNTFNVYTRIQDAMRAGVWAEILAKAEWVREFAQWRHVPCDGVWDYARFLEQQPHEIKLAGGCEVWALRLVA
jgi:hypothetical protein